METNNVNFDELELAVSDVEIEEARANKVSRLISATNVDSGISVMCLGDNCDFASDVANAVTLPLNTWKSGRISKAGNVVWYKFTTSQSAYHPNGAPAYYQIATVGNLDTMGVLYDANGNYINSNDDRDCDVTTERNFQIIALLQYNRTYYIRVSAYGTFTGSYEVSAFFSNYYNGSDDCCDERTWEEKIASASSIAFNCWEFGSITTPGGSAWFKITTNDINYHPKGVDAMYEFSSNSHIDVEGILYDANGNELEHDYDSKDGRNFKFGYNLKYNKTYYLEVMAYGNNYGNFDVMAKVDAPIKNEVTNTSGYVLEADPVDVYSGAHTLKNTLFSMFGGLGINVTAEYNSSKLSYGELGVGWYHNYEKHIDHSLGESTAYVYTNPSNYLLFEKGNANVFNCTAPGKAGYVLTVTNGAALPYCLDCNKEHTEYYTSDGKLAKIVNHHGFETIISQTDYLTTVTDTVTGKSIHMVKNSAGRITTIYDDACRTTRLHYTGGYITEICDVNGNSLYFTYDINGRIKTGTDAYCVKYFENQYNEAGKVEKQWDAEGSPATLFSYTVQDNSTSKVITTNRESKCNTREFYTKNEAGGNLTGLLKSYTDENGNTKTYEYDENHNIIKETDANGNSIVHVFNSFNKPTKITDKNNNVTEYEYDTAGNLTKIKYPAQNGIVPEETFTYNDRNQVLQHTDLRGTITTYTYDANGYPATKKVGNKPAIQYTYVNGLLISEIDANGNSSCYEYNELDLVKSKTDAMNKTTHYTYDDMGNLLTVTNALGATIRYTYDANNQKISESNERNYTTRYTYNGNLKPVYEAYPNGGSKTLEYDNEDRLVHTYDKYCNEIFINYDPAGRVVSKCDADGNYTHYEYDKAGNVVKETNPKGGVTTKTYDYNGNVLTVTDNACNTTSYEYDNMNRIIRKTNPRLGTTVYNYSPAGDLLSETNALGKTTTYTYDAYGNRKTVTDAKGNTTTYEYDNNNNLVKITDALGNVTENTYDCRNLLISVKNAKNQVVRYGYDALGRRTSVTDAKGNTVYTSYDRCGNVIEVTDAKGNVATTTTYNALNLPEMVFDSCCNQTTYQYDYNGKVSKITDALDNVQEYRYNGRGMNTKVIDASSYISEATYDSLGNITALIGPRGGRTLYNYDAMGKLVSESTSSGGYISYGYNDLNLKSQLTNARGQVRNYSYDILGRIIGWTGSGNTATYSYDDNGNILTATDNQGTVTREYDELNRVTKLTDTYGNVICYEYDTVGNLTRMVYPDNTSVVYSYDANNNLSTVTDWEGRTTTYTYDANNKVIGVVYPDGSYATTVYDEKQRVVSTVEKTVCDVVISGFEYTYDELNRISTETNLANNVRMCYTYDAQSRVTKRTVINLANNTSKDEVFAYDGAGNITYSMEDYEGSNFTYDTNNRLTCVCGTPVNYDADGNMLTAAIDCNSEYFSYDSTNRLISAGCNEYTYNVEDVRIRNLCNNTETKFVYNTNARLSQLLVKEIAGVITKYVYGLGLIGEETGSDFKIHHYDYRGSTVALTNMLGDVTDTFAYDTYGKLTSRTGVTNTLFMYNGRDGVVTEDNGLIYMRARYYSPELRRFINADIIHGEISNAITLNRYAYANGNPVSNVDPFGLSAENRSKCTISAAPKHPTSIPNDMLKQILDVYENNMLKCVYIDDYKNNAVIKVAPNGDITYYFTRHNDGLFSELYTTTYYEFKVESAESWKKLLDYDVYSPFDNDVVNSIVGTLDMIAPPNSVPELEAISGLAQWIQILGDDLVGDIYHHNTKASQHILNKLNHKDDNEMVAILSSVVTIEMKKYFWQDKFDEETIFDVNFLD